MPSPQSSFITAGELNVHYLQAGSGPPILLLHGGTATAAISWGAAFAALSSRWRLIAPDSRGHGRTANPADHLGYDQQADDAAALIDALGLGRPVLVGYSDGGQTALEFALRHPGRASAIVLGGTMSRATGAYLHGLREWGFLEPGSYHPETVEAAFGEYYDDLVTLHGDADPAGRDRLLRQISSLWLTLPTYTEDQLGTIRDPVLVIAGDRDELADLDEQARLYRLIPGAELGIVPGSPHGAASRAAFWAMVEDFLNRRLAAQPS